MSATDELRRMLDERGVEWWQSANTLGCIFTRWYSPIFGDEVVAMENGKEGLVLFDHFVTPKQAIEATLGRGTCREVYLLMATDIGDGREEVLGVYATESAATEAINENQFGYALHHVRKLEVTS